MYYIYMLRCRDNSIYTGITTNIDRRMEEHFSKNEKCAKKLEAVWETKNKSLASKLEYILKNYLKKRKNYLCKK